MIRILRVMLGISLVAIILPAVSYALTGRFDAWLPTDNHGGHASLPIAAADALRGPREAIEESRPLGAAALESAQTPEDLQPEGGSSGVDSAIGDTLGDATSDPSATTSHEDHSATTTTVARTATTTPPKPATTAPSVSGGVITGDACPCAVKGTTVLRGTVNLKGDLMVMGGTLVARPGVTVNGNGFQIMFMDGGKADFQGSKTSTWSGNGSNANLSRDVTFKNMRRIMFHQGAGKSTLKHFSVYDSGTSALGDYPIHFHLNGNSTRGTIVEGVVVVNGKHHAFVPHGSHGITFKDTIAKNIAGDAYWWDAPGTNESCKFQKDCTLDNSNDITYDHALADGVTTGPGSSGFRLTGFLLGAGSGNVVRNSAAINIRPSDTKDCSGFHWPERANQNVGGNSWVFQSNYSFSGASGPSGPGGPEACHGIFVWQNDFNNHVIDGFTGAGVEHGAYTNRYTYRRVEVSYLEIHAIGWEMFDSSVGDILVHKHVSDGEVRLTNVQIDSIIMDDAPSGSATAPISLIINGTNASCDDVIWVDAHPESKVIIDGRDC